MSPVRSDPDSRPTNEYAEYLQFAIQLGKDAARMIHDGAKKRVELELSQTESVEVETKNNAVDLVTATDNAVEAHILSSIRARYPTHAFIGEEATSAGESSNLDEADERGKGWVWIVDPVDGTMNFVHTNPNVGSSIGLMHNKNPVVGVIVMPFWPLEHQMFYGSQGGGAWVSPLDGGESQGGRSEGLVSLPKGGRGRPLSGLSGCMTIMDFASDRSPLVLETRTKNMVNLLGQGPGQPMIRALRINGSSMASICTILLGQADLNFDAGPYAWDYCAGSIILKEAGALLVGGKASFARGTDTAGQIVMGRRYTTVRAVAPSKTETSEQIQRRIVSDLYQVVEEWKTKTMVVDGVEWTDCLAWLQHGQWPLRPIPHEVENHEL